MKVHLNIGDRDGWGTACGRRSAHLVDLHLPDTHDEVDCKPCRNSLHFRISEAYRNAVENGYSFTTAREWAEDIVMCDSDLESQRVDTIEHIMKGILR
jgi:hypothetical protein